MTDLSLQEQVDPLMGNSIEGYRFTGKLGQGAFGAVYLARHPRLNRDVAVKYLQLQQQEEFENVEREVHILEQLQHNHIVRIDDTFRFENYQLIMMELVKGGSLRGMLQQLRGDLLDLKTIVVMIDQVAQALDYVHSQQILHLDLKPENILLDPIIEAATPRFVLTDFGIAQFTRPDGHFSNLAGTPRYMSPEQFDFEQGNIDYRADIYALGVILYELIVGHVPFRARMLYELAKQHLHEQPMPPSTVVPDLPVEVENVILTALAKKPSERFQSASALSRALKTATASQTPSRQGNTIDGTTIRRLAQQHAQSIDLLSVDNQPTTRASAFPPASTGVIRISVVGPDSVEKIESFQKPTITIGRLPDCDVILSDKLVSRNHARIDADSTGKLYITDLGSRHGTFLNGDKLVPEQRYAWEANQYLSINGFLLRFMPETGWSLLSDRKTDAIVADDTGIVPTIVPGADLTPGELVGLLNKVQEQNQHPHILLVVSPEIVHVHPGRPYYLKAHVKPENAPNATYQLKVTHGPGGIDESWYTLPAPKMIVTGERQSFDMTITAPMVKSGTYEIFIGVGSDNPNIPDVMQIVKVVVDSSLQYNTTLKPNVLSHRSLPWRRRANLNIINNSNFPETFFIDVEAHDQLKVQPQVREVLLNDMQSKDVKLRITPLRGARAEGRLWYTVKVRPKTGISEKQATGSYAFPPGSGFRPSLFGIVITLVLLILAGFVGLRLLSGATPDMIWSEIISFLSTARGQIEQSIRGLGT